MEKLSDDTWLELVEASCSERPSPELREKILPHIRSIGENTAENIESVIETICREVAFSLCDVPSRIAIREEDLLTMAIQCRSAEQFANFFSDRFGIPCPARLKIYWHICHLEIPFDETSLSKIRSLALEIKNYLEGGNKVVVPQPAVVHPPATRPSPQSVTMPQQRRPVSSQPAIHQPANTPKVCPQHGTAVATILDEVPRRKRSISLRYVQKLDTPEKFKNLKSYFEAKSSNFQYLDFIEFLDVFSRCCESFIQESEEARQLRAKLAEMLPEFIASFGSKEIAKTLMAFARLSHEGAITYKLLFDMACSKIKELNNFQLSNILWVIAVLNFSDQSVVAILAEEAKIRLQTPAGLHYFGLKQLYHFHILSGMLPEVVIPFQERYKLYLQGKLNISERTVPRSPREQEVSDIIHSLVDSNYCEIIDNHREDGLQFDIVIRHRKTPARKKMLLVDVEVDGKSHNSRSIQHKLRNRILNRLGWSAVTRISDDEYRQHSRDELRILIRGKLESIFRNQGILALLSD